MRRFVSFVFVFLFLFGVVFAQDSVFLNDSSGEELYEEEFEGIAEEDIYEGVADVELSGSAGITPDSAFYFLESFFESVLVGDDPETALKYKEEKILEVKEMIEAGNSKAAEKALSRVEKYNEILQKEVTPDLDKRVRESSKATKKLLGDLEAELEGEEWEDVREIVVDNMKDEDRIALASKVSKKIKELCESLSELDPREYSKVCKTDDDAPEWKRDMDEKLTKEQKEEAKKFFEIMSECFENPRECRCDDISVKPFAEQCKVIAPLAVSCEEGDEEACEKMDEVGDPIDLLPDYLQDVMEEVEERYGDAKHDLYIPVECVKEGALSKEACMKVMFRIHAPPECLEALERGEIDPENEREAKKACEEIMFELDAPKECLDAGLTNFQECERYMFKLDAPQECLDAGLTGSGRDDWKKCEVIRFKIEAPPECLEAGITGEGRDDWKKCEVIRFKIDAPEECLDAGLTGEGRDDWRECEIIRFKIDAPKECLDAGLTGEGRDDWRKCEVIRFKLDAPEECLDAGLTGEGRDDWKKCDAIRFELEAPEECLDAGIDPNDRRAWDKCKPIQFRAEAPQECLDAGLTGEGRDDWRECEVIRFKLDAPEECLDAGLTGEGRDDWRKCEVIRFKLDAPKECLDAGLTGEGRDDWRECDRIREKYEDKGERREDCDDDELHICDDGYCKCVEKEEYDESRDHDDEEVWSECKDGCSDECPGADRTDCVNDRCECFYDERVEDGGDSSSDEGGDGGTSDSVDDGSESGSSEESSSDEEESSSGSEESDGSDEAGGDNLEVVE